jgi:hypothetical protein
MTEYRHTRRDIVDNDELPLGAGREKTSGKHALSAETYDGNTSHD